MKKGQERVWQIQSAGDLFEMTSNHQLEKAVLIGKKITQG